MMRNIQRFTVDTKTLFIICRMVVIDKRDLSYFSQKTQLALRIQSKEKMRLVSKNWGVWKEILYYYANKMDKSLIDTVFSQVIEMAEELEEKEQYYLETCNNTKLIREYFHNLRNELRSDSTPIFQEIVDNELTIDFH